MFPPYEFDGAGVLCTVHYVDVQVDGLPDKKGVEFFTKKRFVNEHALGYEALVGKVVWSWQVSERRAKRRALSLAPRTAPLTPTTNPFTCLSVQRMEKVKDVIMSYDGDVDKVRRIRAKLGTRIITCEQAIDLVKHINMDPDEYVPEFTELVDVVEKDPQDPNGMIKRHARVRLYEGEEKDM